MTGRPRTVRLGPGRYRVGPYEIERVTWRMWALGQRRGPGTRDGWTWTRSPTKREAVEAAHREMAACGSPACPGA